MTPTMTPDPAPDLTPEALDALVHMLGEWSACDEEAQAAAITALRARLAEAEAARKRVQQLIEDFNRQVQRTEEQRAAYEARLSVMESDLTAAREEGARMALEAAAQKSDEIAQRHWQAGVDLSAKGDRKARQLADYTSRCVDDVSAAIRALDPTPNTNSEAAERMCLSCGISVPARHDRATPWPHCSTQDACMFDLTKDEAREYWRQKWHDLYAETRALASENARLRAVVADATDADFIEGAIDNVHDMDSTLRDYAEAVVRAVHFSACLRRADLSGARE